MTAQLIPPGAPETAGPPAVLLDDPATPEGQAYARALSTAAAADVRRLRRRAPLPEPGHTPGSLHPDPFLAARGWRVCQHGIYTRDQAEGS